MSLILSRILSDFGRFSFFRGPLPRLFLLSAAFSAAWPRLAVSAVLASACPLFFLAAPAKLCSGSEGELSAVSPSPLLPDKTELRTLQSVWLRTLVEPLVAQLRWPVRARLRHREDSTRAWLDWRSCRHQGPALQGLEVPGRSVLLLSSPLPALLECTNVLLHLFLHLFFHLFEIKSLSKN